MSRAGGRAIVDPALQSTAGTGEHCAPGQRRNYALFLALAIAALTDIGFLFVMWPNRVAVDFAVFWRASRDVTPYVFNSAPFGNPPTALLLFQPLKLLPLWPAYAVWSSAGVLLFLWFGMRLYGLRAATLGTFSPATVMALASGQLSLLIGALIFAAFLAGPVLGGALLGVAFCLKPQMVFLAPVLFLFVRKIRPLLAFLATVAVISILATIMFGTGIWRDWLNGMHNLLTVASARGALNLTVSPMTYGRWLEILSAPLALVGLYLCRNLPDTHRAAVVIGASLFAAPYGLAYDLAPLAVFASFAILRGAGWKSFLAVLTYSSALGPLSIPVLWPALRDDNENSGPGPALPPR